MPEAVINDHVNLMMVAIIKIRAKKPSICSVSRPPVFHCLNNTAFF